MRRISIFSPQVESRAKHLSFENGFQRIIFATIMTILNYS